MPDRRKAIVVAYIVIAVTANLVVNWRAAGWWPW